jgi:hypothetical protein
MKTIFIVLILCMLLFIGCNKAPDFDDPKACTMDAKLCPDGSAVGRDPDNNCEFPACPETKIAAQYRKYASNDAEQCKTVLFQCIEGTKAFSDQSGCGCEAKDPKSYVSKDLSQCEVIRFMCAKNTLPFTDEMGCGCEFSWELADQPKEDENEEIQTFCNPDKRPEICTMEYMPVCGEADNGIRCIKAPCPSTTKQTYGNKCQACSDEKVISWTPGECHQ